VGEPPGYATVDAPEEVGGIVDCTSELCQTR
jgi:hypothetical protein